MRGLKKGAYADVRTYDGFAIRGDVVKVFTTGFILQEANGILHSLPWGSIKHSVLLDKNPKGPCEPNPIVDELEDYMAALNAEG